MTGGTPTRAAPLLRSAGGSAESHGYHPWNAYCGRALAAGLSGPTPGPRPARPTTAVASHPPDRPPDGSATRPAPGPFVGWAQWLHDLHRLAEHLDRLRLDPRSVEGWRTLPAALRHELADTVEILTEVRDALPAAAPDLSTGRIR